MSGQQREKFELVGQHGKNRSFKWDQTSGQFSFSQEDKEHLETAVERLEEMSRRPDEVAILLRRYTGEKCSEVTSLLSRLKMSIKI